MEMLCCITVQNNYTKEYSEFYKEKNNTYFKIKKNFYFLLLRQSNILNILWFLVYGRFHFTHIPLKFG